MSAVETRPLILDSRLAVAQAALVARMERGSPNRPQLASRLQRDVDGDSDSRMPPVIHVVSVVDVVHIDIVGAVPGRRPGFWARINHTEPEASELETRGLDGVGSTLDTVNFLDELSAACDRLERMLGTRA